MEDVMKPVESSYVLGIDLGTTNSSISVYHRKVPQTLPLSLASAGPGGRSLPSAVRFVDRKRDEVVVGRQAKAYALIHPDQVITSVKSIMRRPDWRDDPAVVERLTVDGVLVEPAEIAAEILRELVEQAYAQDVIDLGGEARRAVICVPANSTDEYRRAVHRAAALAGIGEKDPATGEVAVDADGRAAGVLLLEEPVAAALEYGRQIGIFVGQKHQKILVYDLGGGTFDVTVLDVDSSDGVPRFRVLSTRGVARLGGDDFDRVLMDAAAERFRADSGVDVFDLKTDQKATSNKTLKEAQQRLRAAAEEAKISLASGASRAAIQIPAVLTDGEGQTYDLDFEIAKPDYVERVQPLLEQAQQCVREALAAAELTLDDINRVVLVGGSTKADWVKDSIRALYPKGEEREPFVASDVDLIVSQGAAFYGESELRRPSSEPREVIVEGIVQHHLGVELRGALFGLVIKSGLPLTEEQPAQRRIRTFYNPENTDTILISVYKTQKSIEVREQDTEFVTDEHYDIHEHDERGNGVFEHVGEFELRGVPRGPAGTYKVIVDMAIDRENLLKVQAQCEGVEGSADLMVARV